MTANVGIIGVGMIGQDHIRCLTAGRQTAPSGGSAAGADARGVRMARIAAGKPVSRESL